MPPQPQQKSTIGISSFDGFAPLLMKLLGLVLKRLGGLSALVGVMELRRLLADLTKSFFSIYDLYECVLSSKT